MHFIFVKEHKKGERGSIMITTMYVFRRRFICYWACLLFNKAKRKEVETLDL